MDIEIFLPPLEVQRTTERPSSLCVANSVGSYSERKVLATLRLCDAELGGLVRRLSVARLRALGATSGYQFQPTAARQFGALWLG